MMYTVSTLCSFAGFFMLYNTSRKAKLSQNGKFERWLQANPVIARTAGAMLMLVSFVLLALQMGTAVGILTALLILMAAASLVVAIAPMYYFRLRHIVLLITASLLLELLFQS